MAQVDRWTAHTAMREVTALSVSDDVIWAATSGGIFSFDPASTEVRRFTAAEGLHSAETRALTFDGRRNAVWIGYRDGVLDRLDVETGVVRTFFDIQRNDRFPSREINRLVIQGDSLLVATSFGLLVFDSERGEVRDAFTQMGALPPATPVRDVTVAPVPGGVAGFWVATSKGVAYASLNVPNLQDPSVWSIETEALPALDVFSIASFQGSIYVGTEVGLARRTAEGVYTSLPITNLAVVDFQVLPDQLLAVDVFKLYGVDPSGAARELLAGQVDLTSVVMGPDGNLWLGGRLNGLITTSRPTPGQSVEVLGTNIFPEGPFDGIFGDLTVDGEGNLWAAATENLSSSGFYRLDTEGRWTSFTRRFVEELEGRENFTSVYADALGNLWAGSVGFGLAQVSQEGTLTLFDQTNSSLQAAPGTADFVPVLGSASEQDGTLWVTNREASSPLHVRTPDGDWTALPAPSCTGLGSSLALGAIFVDSFGIKWIVVIDASDFRVTRGVLILDTGPDPTDPDDDLCRFLNQRGAAGQGLPSLDITAPPTEDREGRVWIGTAEGPAYVLSSSVAAQDQTGQPIWPQWADRSEGIFVLGDLQVNDIAVDPSNQFWMATEVGAFLLREGEGGFERVHFFSAANAPLFSNRVLAVTVDPFTAEVYFATDLGLISFQGDAIAPAPSKRDLFIFPNPVRIEGGNEPDIFIENLVEETEVQIVAPHGEIVVRFSARGGRVRWNGRDLNNELVPSGVYLVVAVGENGEGAAFGKVAVIR